MNKSIKYLIVAALAVSASGLSAHTEHTYLARRSTNVNLPMELTTFYERTQMKLEGRFGGNLQISGFFGETNSGDEAGKYFGIHNKHKFTVEESNSADFDLSFMIHDMGGEYAAAETTVSYNPSQKSYGARFDYYQNMDKLLKGLYLKVNTTVVHVETKMEKHVNSNNTDLYKALEQFYEGEQVTPAGGHDYNTQKPLTHGKVHGEHSETGVADVDVILGYKFLYKDKYHFGINLGITIPTGNDPDGREMFEPVYGNHSHFGFGGGLDAHANLWTKGEQDIKLNFMANYRYLFEASEKRPLKLKATDYPYVLLGKIGEVGITPAPNILTPLGVDVTPGSQFDGILALAYNNGGFSFDLGYNLYFRSDDDTHLKGKIEENWGVVLPGFNATLPVAQINFVNNVILTNDHIDAKAAETPSQCTNGIYGGLGYHFKKWEYPLLLGLGGKYDWASKNSELDSWSVWAKVALSF